MLASLGGGIMGDFIFFIIFSKSPTMSTYYLYNEENKAKQMEKNESFFLSILLLLIEV